MGACDCLDDVDAAGWDLCLEWALNLGLLPLPLPVESSCALRLGGDVRGLSVSSKLGVRPLTTLP